MAFEAIQKSQRALVDSQRAVTIAEDAKRTAKDGAYTNNRALAEMAREMRRMNAAIGELSEQFGRLLASLSGPLPPKRARAASAEDLMREITGSHKIPSDPAAAIVGRGLFGLAFRGVRRLLPAVIVALIVAGVSGITGWLVRDCSARGAPGLHSR